MRIALHRVAPALVVLASLVVTGPAEARAGKHDATKSVAAKPAKKKASPKKGGRGSLANKVPRKKGSTPGEADKNKRASIAGETPKETAPEPELQEIRDVDDELFPELFEDATKSLGTADSRIVANGLPPNVEPASDTSQATSDFGWMASLEKPDIPFRWDARLVRYLDYFKNNPKGRAFARALVKRAGRYEVKIRAAAKAKGIPEDVVWLSLVESAMNPKTGSSAGAAGLWQFMPKSATAYGLRVDKWVDERLDPERSTEAALRYLGDLHTRFGRWELAFAAYNMGHGGLLTAIRKYNTNDFWELSELEAGVPFETALYVPKIVALAFVSRNKAVFGCDDVVPDAPEPFDLAQVGPGVSLEAVAGAAGTTKATLADMNPALVSDETPPGATQAKSAFPVRVPEGKKAAVEAKLSFPATTTGEPYTLRWGESLDFVASQHGTTESKLRAMNGLDDPTPPRPGTRILVPKGHAALPETPVAVIPSRVEPVPGRERVFYEVVWGDRLGDVASVLGVTTDDLCRWNNIDRDARLHGRMVLQAFVPPEQNLDDVRVSHEADTKVLAVGSEEFFDWFESKNGRTRLVVTVQSGDTIKSLASKYALTIGMMERINHRARNAALVPGEKLVVYTKSDAVRTLASQAKTDDAIER